MRRKTEPKKPEAPVTPDPQEVTKVWIGVQGEGVRVFPTEEQGVAWLRGHGEGIRIQGHPDFVPDAPKRLFTGQLAVDHELERVQPEAYLRVKP